MSAKDELIRWIIEHPELCEQLLAVLKQEGFHADAQNQ